MKKIFLMMVALMMVLASFTGCATQPTTAPSAAPAKPEAPTAAPAKQYTIGMDVARLSLDTFAQFAKVFKDYADSKGWKTVFSENLEDSAKMVSNLENMMAAGVDAIFSHNIDPKASAGIYKQIVDKGIVLVSYDGTSDLATFNFSVDNTKLGNAVGQMAGKWAKANLSEPKVVFFRVAFLDFLITRYNGTVEGWKAACPDCKIVDTVDINMEIVADRFENTLQAHPDANVFIFPGDGDGFVCYQILQQEVARKKLDPKNFGIFANDGSASVIPLIAQGTMYRGTIDLGLRTEVPTAALDAIAYVLTKGAMGKQYPKYNNFPSNVITVENAASFLSK